MEAKPTIEQQIVADIAKRLQIGVDHYGAFEECDDRDFLQETYEEILDGLVYSARAVQRLKNWRRRDDEPTQVLGKGL